MFLISISVHITYIEYSLFKEITNLDLSFKEMFSERTHISIFIPFCFLFLLLVGLLLSFHCFLICHNETTHEYLKDMYHLDKNNKATINPYKITKCFKRMFKPKQSLIQPVIKKYLGLSEAKIISYP